MNKKTYTITVEVMPDGSWNMNRTNDGFNVNELLGVLDFSSRDLIAQMQSKDVADKVQTVTRQVVADGE